MKLTIFLMVTLILQVSATTFAQKVTLSEKNAPLTNVFDHIRAQTGYDFLVNKSVLLNAKPVTLNVKNTELKEVLGKIFANQPLTYEIADKFISVKVKDAQLVEPAAHLEDFPVSGIITGPDGKGLPGATITIKGTVQAVVSGDGGKFYFNKVKPNTILVISYIGYETIEIPAQDVSKGLMEVKLTPSTGKLKDVTINAGYYSVKEEQRTGSIAGITSKEIEDQPVTNPLAAMQGRMAGVNITQATGVPGGSFTIEIRGRNSLQRNGSLILGNDPLYIIDGVPYSSERTDNISVTIEILGLLGVSPLNGINPSDIESIEVLKDADATAIYGSRGANGVVLITTKKGKAGKTTFTLNASTGISKIDRSMQLLNTRQYLEMRHEAFKNDNATPQFYDYDVNGTWDTTRNTDWQKVLIGSMARTHDVEAGVSGGNSNTQFLMSGSYHTEGTVFPGDFNYDKGAFHFNVNHKSDDQRFSSVLSGSYVADKNNLPSGDLTVQAVALAPDSPPLYDANGNVNWANSTWTNPIAALVSKYLAQTNSLTASDIMAYKILPGLEISTTLGFADSRYTEMKTIPSTQYNPAYKLTPASSVLLLTNSKQQTWNIEPQINWQLHIGKGLLSALAGTTFEARSSSQITNEGVGFLSNNLITNISAANQQVLQNSQDAKYRYNAVFGRINYAWDEKYILTLTGRRDGSSRFGPGRQFGNFGAAGGAWIFSKEAFINSALPFLSFGKLRASYGTTGSDQIGDYQFLNTYAAAINTYYDGKGTLNPTRLFNPNFSWQSNKKMDMELDLGFLNDRVLLNITRYRDRASNQLVGIPLPGTTGFPSIQANLGATVQNTGWEIELRTTNVQGKALHWSTSFNLSIPRNKLISFPGLAGSTYANIYVIGQPTNIMKVFHYTGLNPTTGVYQFQDYNNNGTINYGDDQQKIADLSPKYLGGLVNNISYKNFELDFLFQFVKQKGLSFESFSGQPGSMQNQPVDVLNRWQKPGDVKPYEQFSQDYGSAASQAYGEYALSDAAVSDASFIRLKNVSLAYTFPKSVMKGNLVFYMQGQNLLTITSYKGLDPENQSIYQLPPLRTITAGFKLNL